MVNKYIKKGRYCYENDKTLSCGTAGLVYVFGNNAVSKLKTDEEYSGTLLENYLEENGTDYITSDEILNDEEYRDLIGYTEAEQLSEELLELKDTSVKAAWCKRGKGGVTS